MATASNPLVGSSWGGSSGVLPPSPFSTGQGFGQGPGQPGLYQPAFNPGGYGNPSGPKEIQRNIGLENVISAGYKNRLIPQYSQLFGQYGKGAGDFFANLMNQGSPYYKQRQAEAFTQNQRANQSAVGNAEQALNARGYGYGPSGINAATIGGMEMAGAQNEAENYLQNLFQNEQMQLAGAQGTQQVGQMFSPNPLLTGNAGGQDIQQPSTFFQNFSSMFGNLAGAGLGAYGAAK